MGRPLLSGTGRLSQRYSSTLLIAACASFFLLGFLLRPPQQKQFATEIGVVTSLATRVTNKADQEDVVDLEESRQGTVVGDAALKQILVSTNVFLHNENHAEFIDEFVI